MNAYRELLIGCGHSREKRVHCPAREGSNIGTLSNKNFLNLITLDNNSECKPDILFDLSNIARYDELLNTIPGESFDEIHAYEVLEHIGTQGDFYTFFYQFGEFWRLLKPNGYFCATVPSHTSPWAWGDPGHTRIINRGTLVFLDQDEYTRQLGKTSMSDYRKELGDTNFKVEFTETAQETFRFVLRAVK